MYSPSFGYLPNKKQSNLSGSVHHNFSLLRNYSKTTVSTNSFTKLVSSSPEMSPSLKSFDDNHSGNQLNTRTQSIMSIVYSIGHSSRPTRTSDIYKNLAGTHSRHNSKGLVVHYNNLPSIPFVSSHLVGGFVGSKSQLGRTQRFEVKMWDMIRDLMSLVGSSPSTGKACQKSSPIAKKVCGISNLCEKRDSTMSLVKSKELDIEKPRKQSYAEVTKSMLPVSKEDRLRKTTQHRPSINTGHNKFDHVPNKVMNSVKTCTAVSVIKTISKCTTNKSNCQNRQRNTSDCSADSEDSFIVFESCEPDIHVPEDLSDDEYEFHNNVELSTENRSAPTSTSPCGKPTKKVRFAEGKNLKKVHPMITWDYAYRTARPGPWEMLARDSVRFRCRIANIEDILTPVLDQQHRESVYQQRFSS